ncbi:MAG: hypothetical protein RIC55_28970 [Pirellulaceae bacterium]
MVCRFARGRWDVLLTVLLVFLLDLLVGRLCVSLRRRQASTIPGVEIGPAQVVLRGRQLEHSPPAHRAARELTASRRRA